jgi:hypothetical protein
MPGPSPTVAWLTASQLETILTLQPDPAAPDRRDAAPGYGSSAR